MSEEIRFLEPDEVEALYRTAAMTGLRLGELIALRWRDGRQITSRQRITRRSATLDFWKPGY